MHEVDSPLPFSSAGRGFDVHIWLWRLERLSKANKWSDSQILCKVYDSFEGPATFWLSSVTISTWPLLRDQIVKRFGDTVETLYAKLCKLQQHQHSGVAPYTDHFRVLLILIERCGQVLPPALTLSRYLQGLKPELRRQVVYAHPASIDDAYEYALYHEQLLRVNPFL